MKLRTLMTVSAFTLMGGCVSVLPEPEVPNGLYRLGEIAPSVSIDKNIIVREPEGSRVFAGRTIASESEDGVLRLMRGVEWAQPAARMLQIGLLDSFQTEGEGVAIAKGVGAPGDLEIAWRMSDFAVAGTRAVCELQVTVLNGRNREPIKQRRIEAGVAASSDRTEDRAQALAQAARDCIQQTAEFVASVEEQL